MSGGTKPNLDRRACLQTILGGASGAFLLSDGSCTAQMSRPAIKFGSAVHPQLLAGHPAYRELVRRHCRIIVPEGGLKWEGLRPTPDNFWFAPADALMAFAGESGIAVRGHTLVWHMSLPQWARALGTARDAGQALALHIRTVVGRYAGRISSWDVVNEPLPEDPIGADDRRDSLWRRLLGEDYLALALRLAAAADPGAELVINEYDLEHTGDRFARKRAAMLHLLAALRRVEAPLHAIGLQAHLRGERSIDRNGLKAFVREVTGLGLKLLVTELDVMDYALPADIALRDRAIADRATEFLETVFEVCTPAAVLTWGLSDGHAWIPEHFRRTDGAPNRPLPFDRDYQAKPLFEVLQRFGATTRS